MVVNSQSDAAAVEPAASFLLTSGARGLIASGVRMAIRGNGAEWSTLYREFADGYREGAPILVGALPFDHRRPAHLFQPEDVRYESADAIWSAVHPSSRRVERPTRWQVSAEPSADDYQRHVADVLGLLTSHEASARALRKVVLARTLMLQADVPIDLAILLRRLGVDRSVTVFSAPLPPSDDGARTLVGATPELLVDKAGSMVVSEPLAGSAQRESDPAADRRAADALLHSEKDRREHAAVVEWIADHLSPFCRSLRVPQAPSLVSTRFVWHLGTRVEGTLKDDSVSSLELAGALHPTPAVCGLPRDAARAAIARFEQFDRGFFAGAVGWCDTRGDGRWFMTLRCAEVSGLTARLWAGAGIIAGSDPYAERLETSVKFAALLEALGVDEQGRAIATVDTR